MDKAESLIRVYQVCFYICLVVTVLGLANAAFLFFRFNVRGIFEIRSGRAAKRTIRKMAEANAATGRLRPVEMDFTTGGLHSGETGNTATTPLQPADRPPAPAAPAPAPAPAAPARAVRTGKTGKTGKSGRTGFRFEVTQAVLMVHTTEKI